MEEKRLQMIHDRVKGALAKPGALFLVESIEEQTLFLCRGDAIAGRFDASTSRFGSGVRENSFKTPIGIHRIRDRIGAGAPAGRIFRGRRDTGADWDGVSTEENLILTRILRLEGLEQGVNRGEGVDSYGRYIYIHGTNREDLLGTPLSHGCIALRNSDVIGLFDMVEEGTVVYIDPPPVGIAGRPCRSFHFAGIFGSGMSALAQFLRWQGMVVSGSDRLFGSDDRASMRRSLESLGCAIFRQDGSGVGAQTDVVCVSTAIEESNPDIAAARRRNLPVVHRSDLLASLIASMSAVAVAGTSGKSTVTAMIFEFLTACGKAPSLISGAPLVSLEEQGLVGNAYAGGSDLLVVEADESDGTVAKYSPEVSVVLNVSKDHKEVEEIRGLFATLITRSAWSATNAEDPVLAGLPATVRFGRSSAASWRPDSEEVLPTSVRLFKDGTEYRLPMPGAHSLENLRGALCVCEHLGCGGSALAGAVRNFAGVARRFAVTETAEGVHVVDDFAHNPAKIRAAVSAARGLSDRIIAVYQPHGFGPTRFLRDDYIATFRTVCGSRDVLYLLPIYYAGGTARKDISSGDIVEGLGPVPFTARAVEDRGELLAMLRDDAAQGDCVLVMGARDPSLAALVEQVVALFGGVRALSRRTGGGGGT